MMNIAKWATLLIALCLASTPIVGAQTRSRTFTTATSDTSVRLTGTSVYNHRLICTGAGTLSTATVKLEKSVDGSTGWTDLIAGQDCTTNVSATATGWVNYVRITVSALEGTGPVLYVRYEGSGVAASASIDTTGLATSALQGGGLPAALGAGGGLKVDGSGTALPVSGTVTTTQGTAAAVSGAWPIKVTNGTNTAPVDATNGLTVSVSNLTADAAEGAAAGTAPVITGGRADTTENAAVDDGDAVRMATDTRGRQVILPFAVLEMVVKGATITLNATTGQDLIAADANYKFCLTGAATYNSDATNSEVVQILEGGDIGTGTLLFPLAAPTLGGETTTFNPPWCTSAVNKKITVDSAGSANPVAVKVWGFKTVN